MSTIGESSINSNNKMRLPNELMSETVQFIPAGACMVDGFVHKMSRFGPLSIYVLAHFMALSELRYNSVHRLHSEREILRSKADNKDYELKLIKSELNNISVEEPVDLDKLRALAQRVNVLEEKDKQFKEALSAFRTKADAFKSAWKSSHEFAEQLVNNGGGTVEKIGEEEAKKSTDDNEAICNTKKKSPTAGCCFY